MNRTGKDSTVKDRTAFRGSSYKDFYKSIEERENRIYETLNKYKWLMKFKNSFFIANKLYIFVIFVVLTFMKASFGAYYFVGFFVIYVIRLFYSKVPIDIADKEIKEKHIHFKTYVYKEVDGKELKLDIWYPSNADGKSYPFVYFAHGGGWISGFRNQPNNVSWCKYIAASGYAVVSIDYRYGYENSMLDILSDYSDGLNYVRNNYKKLCLDRNNIVLMGLSAGGHLSLLFSGFNTYNAEKDSEKKARMRGVRSVVAYYSPTDLHDMFTKDSKSLFVKFATLRTLKGKPAEESEIYGYYSPISWVSSKMIPCLIVHGMHDRVVPFMSSINYVTRLERRHVKNSFLVHEKADHSFDTRLKDKTTKQILDKTIRFIGSSFSDS